MCNASTDMHSRVMAMSAPTARPSRSSVAFSQWRTRAACSTLRTTVCARCATLRRLFIGWFLKCRFGGSTSVMAEAVEQFRERVLRTNEDLAVRQNVETIALTTGRSERWVREAFTRDHGADAKVFPGGFEMLLVPGAFVAATVHAPIGPPSGLPVPLGFASFDPRVLARAGKLLEANANSFKLGETLIRNLVAPLSQIQVEDITET